MNIGEKKNMALALALLACLLAPAGPRAESLEAVLENARAHAGQAFELMDAYHDSVILPRKTPTQTSDARGLRNQAREQAEAALRRFEAVAAEGKSLSSSDLVLSGRCRLVVLDNDRPSTQTESDRQTILTSALKDFSSAWTMDKANAPAHAGMVDVDRIMLDQEAGEAVIKSAGDRVANNPVFALAAGRLYIETGDAESALGWLEQAAASGDAEPLLYLAAAHYMNGDRDAARDSAKAALRKRPGLEAASLLIEHIEAIGKVESGGSPGPRGSRHLVSAGAAFEQRGDHGLALFIYKESARAMPDDSRALYMHGESLAFRARDLGDKAMGKRAAEILGRAMAKGGMPDVNEHAALVPMAMAYEAAGDYGKASDTYRKIVEHDPNYYKFYFALARCLEARGNNVEAEKYLARAKALAPKTTYSVGSWMIRVDQTIGSGGDCDNARVAEGGNATIKGRVLAAGEGLPHARVELFLDDCSAKTPGAETDGEGNFTVSLPAGTHVYNGIGVTHFPRAGERTLKEMIYVPSKLDGLYEVSVDPRTGQASGNPGEFSARAGSNQGLSFTAEFVPPIEVASPSGGKRYSAAEVGSASAEWSEVPGAASYKVSLFMVEGNSFSMFSDGARFKETSVPLSKIFAANMTKAGPGDYAILVEAQDDDGQVVARSAGVVKFSIE